MADPRFLSLAGRLLVGVVLLGAIALPEATAEKRRTLEELTNFALGAQYSQWLVGPVSRIATPKEISIYLELIDDESAERFIETFWKSRADPGIPWPDQQPRAVFERRTDEADRRFTEGVTRGRRTDRGEVYIVYGPPDEVDYEADPDAKVGAIEVWRYGKDAARGLDGEKPKKLYRFAKQGELTEFYSPGPGLPRSRRRGVDQ